MCQTEFFFLPLPAITSAMENFLYLPAQIVLDRIASVKKLVRSCNKNSLTVLDRNTAQVVLDGIASAVVAINQKLVRIFSKNSLTVLDRPTSFLSLHISLAVSDRFLFLRMFHFLHLPVRVSIAPPKRPPHKRCNNTYYYQHGHSPDGLFFLVISFWLYGLVGFSNGNAWRTSPFAMSFINVDRLIFMTLVAL